jgi:hypothetical protein
MAKVRYEATGRMVEVDGKEYEVFHKRIASRGRPVQFIKRGGKYKRLHG